MIVVAAIDRPQPGAVVRPLGFAVEGWFASRGPVREVRALSGQRPLGKTASFFERPDASTALPEFTGSLFGFLLWCSTPLDWVNQELRVDLEAIDADGAAAPIGSVAVTTTKIDYRKQDYGAALASGGASILHRSDIYTSGPPVPYCDPACFGLVERYMRGCGTVIDVGCGIGAYGVPLTRAGLAWTGCEVDPRQVNSVRDIGLRAELIKAGAGLPFRDHSFDGGMAIEVLEHVDDIDGFLSEMRRIAPRLGVFSVPNAGAIPVTHVLGVVPWHLLEGDHKNFFTTHSLKAVLERWYEDVEVFEYGPLQSLQPPDGCEINNHLFAVARVS